MEFFNGVWQGIISTSFLEWSAVITSIIYVILAAKRLILCWFFAIITSCLYIYICFSFQLYIETVLQVFYLVMAFLGWYLWHKNSNKRVDIKKWAPVFHLINISLSAIATLILGYLFAKYTDQVNPYVDAFTTCFSLAATFMVTRKILENWIYWILIDLVSIYLYAERGLQLTAVLFLLFTILAVVGYFSWLSKYKLQRG